MECSVRSISLNKFVKYFDGQWQGITVGSDGACYFGASSHSPRHGSSFFKFEPGTSESDIYKPWVTEAWHQGLIREKVKIAAIVQEIMQRHAPELKVSPQGLPVRVRGIHAQNRESAGSIAVERTVAHAVLAFIPSGKHQPAELIGYRHQEIRPDTRLQILLGYIGFGPFERGSQRLNVIVEYSLDRYFYQFHFQVDGFSPSPVVLS